MGITIHYRFVRTCEPEDLMKKAELIAKKLGWEILERGWNKLIVHPEENCESVCLHWHKVKTVQAREGWDYDKATLKEQIDLDENDWYCSGFTKTQYAGYQTHIQVAEFLRFIGAYCIKTEVCDEAGYYESRDVEDLKKEMDESSKMIGNLAGLLKEAFGKENVIAGGDE